MFLGRNHFVCLLCEKCCGKFIKVLSYCFKLRQVYHLVGLPGSQSVWEKKSVTIPMPMSVPTKYLFQFELICLFPISVRNMLHNISVHLFVTIWKHVFVPPYSFYALTLSNPIDKLIGIILLNNKWSLLYTAVLTFSLCVWFLKNVQLFCQVPFAKINNKASS